MARAQCIRRDHLFGILDSGRLFLMANVQSYPAHECQVICASRCNDVVYRVVEDGDWSCKGETLGSIGREYTAYQ